MEVHNSLFAGGAAWLADWCVCREIFRETYFNSRYTRRGGRERPQRGILYWMVNIEEGRCGGCGKEIFFVCF